jgi:arabinose-5-phosphate isomerase
LRRHLETDPDAIHKCVKNLMTKKPTVTKSDRLAAEALEIMRSKRIDELPVVDEKGRPIGLLDVQDILKAGLV